jgi:hypothetical protein
MKNVKGKESHTEDSDNELAALATQLQRIQLELNVIKERVNTIQENNVTTGEKETSTNAEEELKQKNKNELSVRTRVIVTNRYKGKYGVEGTIIRVTNAQVIIRPSNGGEDFRKWKQNVRAV